MATAALNAAYALLTGAQYVADKLALDTARTVLTLTDQAGQLAITGSGSALDNVQKAGDLAVQGAQHTLSATEGLLKSANYALEEFRQASYPALHSLELAVLDLVKSVEYLSYTAASSTLDLAKKAADDTLQGFQYAVAKAGEGVRLAKRVTQYVTGMTLHRRQRTA